MNKRTFKMTALFMSLFTMGLFSSCSDDDSPVDEPKVEVVDGSEITREGDMTVVSLKNPGYGEDNWIYFSLSQHTVLTGINESNRATDTSWDIAFYRYYIRTNSGLSGKGNCGAFDTEKMNMKDVTSVPADITLTVDEIDKVTSSMSSFPPPTMDAPLNKKMGEAIKFQGPPPSYEPNGHIYIVKTVEGKYVKMQITGFADKDGNNGHLQFRYEFLN